MKITRADFIKSASRPPEYPGEGLPEAAFAGRSNVGKSSLINRMTNRKGLARISKNPGHTRSLNFFRVNQRLVFADLPGYGFARVSHKEREQWKRMVETYLSQRDELRAVVLIMDIRRDPEDEELQLMDYLESRGLVPVPVATKADRIGKTKRPARIKAMAKALGLPPEEIVAFSARTGEGREELWRRLREVLE